jgi:hypothetical protein
VSNTLLNSPVLARIPVAVDYGYLQSWEATNDRFSEVKDFQVRYLMIRVLDDQGFDLDFQGSQFSLSVYIQSFPRPLKDLTQFYQDPRVTEQHGSTTFPEGNSQDLPAQGQ